MHNILVVKFLLVLNELTRRGNILNISIQNNNEPQAFISLLFRTVISDHLADKFFTHD